MVVHSFWSLTFFIWHSQLALPPPPLHRWPLTLPSFPPPAFALSRLTSRHTWPRPTASYMCVCAERATPSLACIVHPGSSESHQKLFFGREEVAIPVYGS